MSLEQFNQIIQNTLSTDNALRENATNELDTMVLNQANAQMIIEYISTQQHQIANDHRLMAAIQLKNTIKKVYGSSMSYSSYNKDQPSNGAAEGEQLLQDDPANQIDDGGRQVLQNSLVGAMMQSSAMGNTKLTNTFLEIIAIMGRRYVQKEWQNLFPSLIQELQTNQDLASYKTVFECAKKICKKYRYMFRSDDLYSEMNYVIGTFSDCLIGVLKQCYEMAQNPDSQKDETSVKNLFSVMNSILHIIESILSQEELPDYYEENLPSIIQACLFILGQDYPMFQKIPEEIIKARGKVVSLVYLYTFKFGEYFSKYSETMFQAIWTIIDSNKVQATKQCEKLVRATVRYMGEMSNNPSKSEFVKMNLMKIFDILVLPNIAVTSEDQEEYEDDPDAYIRNDLEEADTETRRRHCMKFVHTLSKKFPNEVGELIGNYVNKFLADYQNNRANEWAKKTTLLNLLITASISQYTYKSGASEINIPDQQLFEYLQQLVLPELQEQDIDTLQILKATCLKFVYMFRNQIPDDNVQPLLGLFCQFLNSESTVNQSYASACIEKMLIKKSNTTKQPVVTSENIDGNILSNLLQNLCNLLKEQKNLYAIRALYRVIQISQSKVQEFTDSLGALLGQFIHDTAKDENEQSPNYIYILFETTALTMKYMMKSDELTKLQGHLTPALNFIVENNKTDLMGYAFQIYALFVARSEINCQLYEALTTSIIQNQDNWGKSMKYLIPSLGQFLISMICKFPDYIKQYSNEVGNIIKHLLSTDIRMETVALQIGSALFERIGILDENLLKDFLFQIFTTMHFYRNNTKNKTIPVSITRAILIFFATFMVNYGSDALLQTCDKIQPGILFMILKSEGDKFKFCMAPPRDRKYVICAFSNLISERPELYLEDSLKTSVTSLIELSYKGMNSAASGFSIASLHEKNAEDMLEDGAIDQTFAFQRQTHIQLHSSKVEQRDKLADMKESVEQYFMTKMNELTQKQQQSIQNYLTEEKAVGMLQSICQTTGIGIQ